VCQDGLWLSQSVLLGTRQDMEDIAAALGKVQRHAGALKTA
jgi:hypothetical protein